MLRTYIWGIFFKWHDTKISSFQIGLKLGQFIALLDRILHTEIQGHRTISLRMREGENFYYNLRTVGFKT